MGVILLSLLSGQFPFFESKDDADALVEIATLLGLNEMKAFADKLSKLEKIWIAILARMLTLVT